MGDACAKSGAAHHRAQGKKRLPRVIATPEN